MQLRPRNKAEIFNRKPDDSHKDAIMQVSQYSETMLRALAHD